jgi:hypothetical protein
VLRAIRAATDIDQSVAVQTKPVSPIPHDTVRRDRGRALGDLRQAGQRPTDAHEPIAQTAGVLERKARLHVGAAGGDVQRNRIGKLARRRHFPASRQRADRCTHRNRRRRQRHRRRQDRSTRIEVGRRRRQRWLDLVIPRKERRRGQDEQDTNESVVRE